MVGGDGSFEPGMIRYDTIQYMIYDIRYDCFDFNQSNLLDTMSLYVVGVCRMSYFFLSLFGLFGLAGRGASVVRRAVLLRFLALRHCHFSLGCGLGFRLAVEPVGLLG